MPRSVSEPSIPSLKRPSLAATEPSKAASGDSGWEDPAMVRHCSGVRTDRKIRGSVTDARCSARVSMSSPAI